MIRFDSFTLKNGLRVIVHEDHAVQIAVLNILYDVGSRDEQASKTGFAHLFEHLMFGGSKNIPSYDEPLQKVGGENNAFTSPDITNYYITLPAENIETAFWLESDRMLSLSFDPKVLEVQRSVVIEEFKQRYLTQPYGDVWLKLRPLAYDVHSYRWPTIGKEISHIEQATMDDVKGFFFKYYVPCNAIMVVGGPVKAEEIKRLAQKWFAPIPSGTPYHRALAQEPVQSKYKKLETSAKVPLDALYMTFHMASRVDEDYFTTDMLSDILGRGKSSRFYDALVSKDKMFNNLSAHVMGSMDPGLLVVEGKLNKGRSLEEAEAAIWNIVGEAAAKAPEEAELSKVKHQAESTVEFGEVELLNRCMNLAFAAEMGDPEIANQEIQKIRAVTTTGVQQMAQKI